MMVASTKEVQYVYVFNTVIVETLSITNTVIFKPETANRAKRNYYIVPVNTWCCRLYFFK